MIECLFRQSRVHVIIWSTLFFNLLFCGLGIADSSTIISAGPNPSIAPTELGCHKRLYTYRITQADTNGIQMSFVFVKLFRFQNCLRICWVCRRNSLKVKLHFVEFLIIRSILSKLWLYLVQRLSDCISCPSKPICLAQVTQSLHQDQD